MTSSIPVEHGIIAKFNAFGEILSNVTAPISDKPKGFYLIIGETN